MSEDKTTSRKSNKDMVLPCLLDRLTDRYPKANADSERFRYITAEQYRDSVLRDLCWLLNSASHLVEDEIDEEFDHVRKSVFTYGIGSMTGLDASQRTAERIRDEIKDALLKFEPRIVPETLKVELMGKSSGNSSGAVAVYEIKGELWSLPFAESLYLKTEIDLETGICKIKDKTRDHRLQTTD